MLSMHSIAFLSAWLCSAALIAADLPIRTVQVRVAHETTHRFAGFGVSVSNRSPPGYGGLDRGQQHRLSQLLWGEARCRIARLWIGLDQLGVDQSALQDFQRRYVDSGYLADAMRAGCEILLLGPSNIPRSLRRDPAAGPYKRQQLRDDASATTYGRMLAELIVALHDELGVLCQVTGVQNEPSSRVKLSPQQFADATKALRHHLDQAGEPYRKIRIIGPECASVDGTCDRYVQALRRDRQAWQAIDAVAAHAYNMCLKEPFASDWLQDGKPYWNTEAGNTVAGNEQGQLPYGAAHGTALASRFLNDLRQGCSHWIWFLGYEQASNKAGDQHRLIRWQRDGRIETLPTYAYLRELAQALPPGSDVLAVACQPPLQPWTYGRKDLPYLAAVRQPESKNISIALCNYSSGRFATDPSSGSDFFKRNCGQPAHLLRFDIELHRRLAAGDQAQVVHFGGEELPLSDRFDWPTRHSTIEVRAGRLSVSVAPMELCLITIDTDN